MENEHLTTQLGSTDAGSDPFTRTVEWTITGENACCGCRTRYHRYSIPRHQRAVEDVFEAREHLESRGTRVVNPVGAKEICSVLCLWHP